MTEKKKTKARSDKKVTLRKRAIRTLDEAGLEAVAGGAYSAPIACKKNTGWGD